MLDGACAVVARVAAGTVGLGRPGVRLGQAALAADGGHRGGAGSARNLWPGRAGRTAHAARPAGRPPARLRPACFPAAYFPAATIRRQWSSAAPIRLSLASGVRKAAWEASVT